MPFYFSIEQHTRELCTFVTVTFFKPHWQLTASAIRTERRHLIQTTCYHHRRLTLSASCGSSWDFGNFAFNNYQPPNITQVFYLLLLCYCYCCHCLYLHLFLILYR